MVPENQHDVQLITLATMKKVTFEYDENKSLNIILNEVWWFSLSDLAAIMEVQEDVFIKTSRVSHCREIAHHPFCTFQECCRRFIRSTKLETINKTDWFFQTVVPQLRSMESEVDYEPITNHWEIIELENQEILARINKLEAGFSEKVAQITTQFEKCLKALAQHTPSSPPVNINELREQQRDNHQIVGNFIRSNEDAVPPSLPPLDPFMGLMGQELIHNGNGNGNGNGRTRDEIR